MNISSLKSGDITAELHTLSMVVGNLGYNLGCFTVWHREERGSKDYVSGSQYGTICTARRNLRDILKFHPGLKRSAAKWIRAGIAGAKGQS